MSAPLESPVVVAWENLAPVEEHLNSPLTSRAGRCAICQRNPIQVEAIADVVSANYTAFDVIDLSADGFCQACSWAHRERSARRSPVIVSGQLAGWSRASEIKELLSAPLPMTIACSLPIGGRRHVLPFLEWGKVVTDRGTFSWDENAAKLMSLAFDLTRAGAKEDEIVSEPAPPFRILKPKEVNTAKIMEIWERVLPWQGTPHLRVAAAISAATPHYSFDFESEAPF